MKKPYVEITFSSGAVLTFEAERLSTKHSSGTGLLTEVSWDGAVNAPQYLQLANIDSVRYVRP